MRSIERRILAEVEAVTDELVEFTRALVRIPTVNPPGDCYATCAELTSLGVEIISPPHLIHKHESGVEEWMAFFNDPDGHPLALMTQVGLHT